MKRFYVLAGVLLAAFLTVSTAAGCGGTSTTSTTSSSLKLYFITNTDISAKVGDKFVIQLDSNRTTGFQWGISGSLNPAVVKKISSLYAAPSDSSGMTGVGGSERWSFQAVGVGTATIVLIYTQPFNSASNPAKTATFKLTVTK